MKMCLTLSFVLHVVLREKGIPDANSKMTKDWSFPTVLQENTRGTQELLSWLDREHKCVACGKHFTLTTSWKQRLDRHINMHQGIRPFACQYCGKFFARKDALKLHVSRVHVLDADRSSVLSWSCVNEDHTELVMITDRVAGVDHVLVKIIQSLSWSPIVLQVGECEQELLLFDMSPTDGTIEQRTCPICKKVFSSPTWKQKLDRHILIHTGAKPFACPHCPHRSNRKDNLRHHINIIHRNLVGVSQDMAGSNYTM